MWRLQFYSKYHIVRINISFHRVEVSICHRIDIGSDEIGQGCLPPPEKLIKNYPFWFLGRNYSNFLGVFLAAHSTFSKLTHLPENFEIIPSWNLVSQMFIKIIISCKKITIFIRTPSLIYCIFAYFYARNYYIYIFTYSLGEEGKSIEIGQNNKLISICLTLYHVLVPNETRYIVRKTAFET